MNLKENKIFALATIFILCIGGYATSAAAATATHSVERGESLWSISQEYNLSIEELKELNQLNSDIIFPEQALKVEKEGISYLIKEGDSLYSIALTHNVEVDKLMQWNNLTSELIFAGDTLVLKEPTVLATKQTVSDSSLTTNTNTSTNGESFTMVATAYTAYCEGCIGITKNGTDIRANPHLKVIAVDPTVIPIGTKVWVEGYGEAIAADTGGAIKGNRIDVFIPNETDAHNWGIKSVKVKVLN